MILKRILLLFILVSLCKCIGERRKTAVFNPLEYQTDPGFLLDRKTGKYHWRRGTPLIDDKGHLREGADTALFISYSKLKGIEYEECIISSD